MWSADFAVWSAELSRWRAQGAECKVGCVAFEDQNLVPRV